MVEETSDTAALGVELLLLRMDTHPEEFDIALNSKWVWFMDALVGTLYTDPERLSFPLHKQLRFISREDLKKLYAKISTLQGTSFTERVTLAVHGVMPPENDLFKPRPPSDDRSPF